MMGIEKYAPLDERSVLVAMVEAMEAWIMMEMGKVMARELWAYRLILSIP